MSRLTYLGHSGFLLEWTKALWLFDYWQGELPHLNPKKPLLVFVSHRHEDHFSPAIFSIAHPNVHYVFSDDIVLTEKRRKTWGVPGDADILLLPPGASLLQPDWLDSPLQIQTLPSTDEGVAFVLGYEGKTVYHAGDLNWWDWPGEGAEWNEPMAARFQAAVSPLAGRSLDLAMAPLDSRQEGSYAMGLAQLLRIARVKQVVPMHFWEDASVIARFQADYSEISAPLVALTQPGATLELDW